MVSDNKNTLNKETISFYSYDNQLDAQKTESNGKEQEKSNLKTKKFKVQKNYFFNKKKLIGICFFILSFLILILAFLKAPYTGAILDNVLEFFFWMS